VVRSERGSVRPGVASAIVGPLYCAQAEAPGTRSIQPLARRIQADAPFRAARDGKTQGCELDVVDLATKSSLTF